MESKPKTSPEFDRFNALVDRVLTVPKAEIQKREAEYQREAQKNLKRRGPKIKGRKPAQ